MVSEPLPSLRCRLKITRPSSRETDISVSRRFFADIETDFTLRLPGFSVDVSKYIDKKNHELRYVLKNKATGDIYFVLLFTLLLNQQQAETEDEPEENEEENEVD